MDESAASPRLARKGLMALVGVIMLALFLPAAYGQNAEPPKPADFKGMSTPGAPATLTTAPAASLITPPTGATAKLQPGFNGSRMVMTQAVWQTYLRYLQDNVRIGFGFFMITVDGTQSDVKQCKNYTCQISPVSQYTALSECQAKMRNRRCIVFAEGRDIKYAYQVVP